MAAPLPTSVRISFVDSRSRTRRSSPRRWRPDRVRQPMSRNEPHLRIVGSEESIRRRRPGLALVLVLLYAALFGGALWYLAARTGIWRRKSTPKPSTTASASVAPAAARHGRGDGATGGRGVTKAAREALLGGEGVAEAGKERYFSRLATERCDCGCSRTLSDCLVNEKSCSKSPELARKIREAVNASR